MIDLHTHSSCSDGSDPPQDIPALAEAAGCKAVALVDHDSLAGIPPARRAAEEIGIDFVPGCEISCAAGSGPFHLLVYFVSPGDAELDAQLARLRQDRRRRNAAMLAALAGQGVAISAEELAVEAVGGEAGRPHLASLMVQKGYAPSLQAAFDRWLGPQAPAYVPKARLSPLEAITLARSAGGLPVLAHPARLGVADQRLRSMLGELAGIGLVGLECHYGDYPPHQRAHLVALARSHGLVPTGGSDYHGTYKPHLRVGTGTGDLAVPDACLEELREHLS